MDNPNPAAEDIPDGWHAWQSTGGHWWASRDKPYEPREEKAGAWRTVDGDDVEQLRAEIAKQEAIVDQAWGRPQ